MKRFECILEFGDERRSEGIITNMDVLKKGMLVRIKGIDWKIKFATPADSNKVRFGDIIHEVKK